MTVFVLNFGVLGNVQNCFLGAAPDYGHSHSFMSKSHTKNNLVQLPIGGIGRGSVNVIDLYYLMKLRTFHTEHSGVKNAHVSFVWVKGTE